MASACCASRRKVEGYRTLCRKMEKPFARQSGSVFPWLCALAPEVVPDFKAALRSAETTSTDPATVRNASLTVAALLFRSGQSPAAFERLEKLQADRKPDEVPFDWYFLAMTQHRLGHAGEASKWFAKAVAAQEAATAKGTLICGGGRCLKDRTDSSHSCMGTTAGTSMTARGGISFGGSLRRWSARRRIEGTRGRLSPEISTRTPFESAVAASDGLHALGIRSMNALLARKVRAAGGPRDFFYNPMWRLYGLQSQFEAGSATNYWVKEWVHELAWHMVDQVVLRPGECPHFPEDQLRILTHVGGVSLLDARNLPDPQTGSDHLPVVQNLRYNCYLRTPATSYSHLLFQVSTPVASPWVASIGTPEGEKFTDIDSETKLTQAIGEILQRERTKGILAYLLTIAS